MKSLRFFFSMANVLLGSWQWGRLALGESCFQIHWPKVATMNKLKIKSTQQDWFNWVMLTAISNTWTFFINNNKLAFHYAKKMITQMFHFRKRFI